MKLFLSVTTAWLCTLGVFILSVIYLLRVINKSNKIKWVSKVNRKLRKIHTPVCHITLILAIIHGLLSAVPLISVNTGTLATALMLLMGVIAMMKKKLKKFWMPSHRLMTLVVCILVVIHIVKVGFVGLDRYLDVFTAKYGDQSNEMIVSETDKENNEDIFSKNDDSKTNESLSFIDGEYQGISNGFGDELTVKVIVENQKITLVEIIDHNEVGEQIYGKAFNNIPDRIVEKQSTDVDSVSGATYSSYGIMLAVEDALKDAVETGELPIIDIPKGIRLK